MADPTPEPESEKPDAPGSRKRLVLWGAVAAAVVALAAGAALYLAPWQSDVPSAPKPPPTAYFEFPKIKTDLKPTGRFRHMITLQVVVELTADGLPRLDAVKSKILDGFHVRLRELQQSDLVGKAEPRACARISSASSTPPWRRRAQATYCSPRCSCNEPGRGRAGSAIIVARARP